MAVTVETCRPCRGYGHGAGKNKKCPRCLGSGRVEIERNGDGKIVAFKPVAAKP